MKINFEKTKKKLLEEGYSIKGYARSPKRNLNPTSFFRLLNSDWIPKGTEGVEFKRIVDCLKADGLLVEEEDDPEIKAA